MHTHTHIHTHTHKDTGDWKWQLKLAVLPASCNSECTLLLLSLLTPCAIYERLGKKKKEKLWWGKGEKHGKGNAAKTFKCGTLFINVERRKRLQNSM